MERGDILKSAEFKALPKEQQYDIRRLVRLTDPEGLAVPTWDETTDGKVVVKRSLPDHVVINLTIKARASLYFVLLGKEGEPLMKEVIRMSTPIQEQQP